MVYCHICQDRGDYSSDYQHEVLGTYLPETLGRPVLATFKSCKTKYYYQYEQSVADKTVPWKGSTDCTGTRNQ